jgi:hypothetical protein
MSTKKEWYEGRWEGLREALAIVRDSRQQSRDPAVRDELWVVEARIAPLIPAKEDDRG